jgi:hypothetical protein
MRSRLRAAERAPRAVPHRPGTRRSVADCRGPARRAGRAAPRRVDSGLR